MPNVPLPHQFTAQRIRCYFKSRCPNSGMMPEASLCSLSQGVGLTAEVLLKCSWQSQGHTHTHVSCRSVPKYSSQNTSAWHWTQLGFRYHSQLRAGLPSLPGVECEEEESQALCTDSSQALAASWFIFLYYIINHISPNIRFL